MCAGAVPVEMKILARLEVSRANHRPQYRYDLLVVSVLTGTIEPTIVLTKLAWHLLCSSLQHPSRCLLPRSSSPYYSLLHTLDGTQQLFYQSMVEGYSTKETV